MADTPILRRLSAAVVIFVAVVVALLFAVPHAAGYFARRALERHPVYDGSFDSLDVDLLAARVTVRDLMLRKKGQKEGEPFISAGKAVVNIRWKPLLERQIIGDVIVDAPRVHVVAHAVEKEKEEAKEAVREKNVVQAIQEIMPFRVDRFEIRDGVATYRNPTARPPIDVRIDHLDFLAENLTNRENLSGPMPGRARLTARLMNSGALGARLQFAPFAESPLFNLDLRLRGLDLRAMNDFIRHYAGMDVAKGTLTFAAEVAVDGGRYKGYLKPLLQDFQMRGKGEAQAGPVAALKEWAVETLEHIFENEETEMAGTRVPFSGTLRDPSVDVWTAVIEIFRNAFFQALSPFVEERYELGDPDARRKG